jgi:hypothetical protein
MLWINEQVELETNFIYYEKILYIPFRPLCMTSKLQESSVVEK